MKDGGGGTGYKMNRVPVALIPKLVMLSLDMNYGSLNLKNVSKL